MGRRKAEKSADFSKIRDAEGRIVTRIVFLKISFAQAHKRVDPSLRKKEEPPDWVVLLFPNG